MKSNLFKLDDHLTELREAPEAYFCGIHHLEETANGLFPNRLSPELMALFQYSEAAIIRANCTTQVRIRFQTDSSLLHLGLFFGKFARHQFLVTLCVDGAAPIIAGPISPENGMDELFVLPGEGIRTVTVYLPHLVQCFLTEFELSQGACLMPAPSLTRKIIFVGDSIIQGMTSTCAQKAMAGILTTRHSWEIHNTAVGGALLVPEAVRLSRCLGGDTLVIAAGTNDFGHDIPIEQFQEDCLRTCQILLESQETRKLYVVTPIPCPKREVNSLGITLEEYRNILRQALAGHPEINILEGPRFFPNDNAFFYDGLHPNDQGMILYANALDKALN